MAIIFGLLSFILTACIDTGSKWNLIPLFLSLFGFISSLRFLKFQEGMSRIAKIIGMILCGFSCIFAFLRLILWM